jgi:hypothetical protein
MASRRGWFAPLAGTCIGLSLGLAIAGPAAACSCSPENVAAQYARATDVFVATAGKGPGAFPGSQDGGGDGGAGGAAPTTRQVTYELDVDEVVKGSVTKGATTVSTSSDAAACGVVFEAGKSYLVFAKREPGDATSEGSKDVLQTDLCMGSVTGDQMTAAIDEVRRLSQRTVTPSESP